MTDSRGPARAARGAVVVTVLAAPLLTTSSVTLLLEEPDHIGTSAFLLASFLLIDRAPGRRFTAPLLCVILCAGQLSDLTVRYVAVSAVLLVCGYRVLAARRLRSGDAALVVAAAASVPLESLIRAAMRHLGAYSMAAPALSSHEIAAVLPCGAVLAARACVPARITGMPRAFLVVTATTLAALVPLAAAATRPPLRPATAPLAAWLEAHGLTYGIAWYWNASVVTMQSGDRVQIRAVEIKDNKVLIPVWAANALWYNPSRYDARFVVADHLGRYPATAYERHFGRPAATYRVASWYVLIYRTNLLRQLRHYPNQLVPARASPPSYFELKTRPMRYRTP